MVRSPKIQRSRRSKMSNMLEEGVGWLTEQLEESASVRALYRRGTSVVGVRFTQGQTEYAAVDDEGDVVTKYVDATFICPRAALVLNGTIVDPVAGDRIELKQAEHTITYEVMVHGGERCFSLDATRQVLRILAKQVIQQ